MKNNMQLKNTGLIRRSVLASTAALFIAFSAFAQDGQCVKKCAPKREVSSCKQADPLCNKWTTIQFIPDRKFMNSNAATKKCGKAAEEKKCCNTASVKRQPDLLSTR